MLFIIQYTMHQKTDLLKSLLNKNPETSSKSAILLKLSPT